MSMLKKVLLGILVLVAVVVAAFLIFIGPWPAYEDSKFAASSYYKKALADIDANVAKSELAEKPDKLWAGWGSAIMTPKIGAPLGGYSARGGKPSTGVRDELYSRAICLGDGKDMAALIGNDILIVTPNIADLARKKIAAETPLNPNNIQFCASHTHCGAGAFAPGLVAKISSGSYDPAVEQSTATAMANAVIEAYKSMAPAKLADCQIDAPEFIKNRTRNGTIDSMLKYLVLEKESGERCILVRYSAHPTNFDDDMMKFSAEYPGALVRNLEKDTKAAVVYLGGAVGSMGPKAPDGPTADDRVEQMGAGLAKKLEEHLAANPPQFKTNLDIASVGIPIGMPSPQMRPIPGKLNLRLSPFAIKIAGLDPTGWIQGIRVGSILFVGLPYDTSGELARQWREEYASKGWDLWVEGFSGTYCGYLTPDKYYKEVDKKGELGYENGALSWFGPNAEAYFKALIDHIALKMGDPKIGVAQAQSAAPERGAA